MASRPLAGPFQAINNGTMTANIAGKPSIVNNMSMVSYSFTWSGTTPVGTVAIQVSDDYSTYADGTVNNPGTWNNLPITYSGSSVTSIPLTGNTGNGIIEGITSSYAIRPYYAFTSGTGTLNAIFTGKVQ
jgi:hypothetical protein